MKVIVQNGAFTHSVNAAQDVDVPVQLPHYVLPAIPQRVYLYLFYVLCVFHTRKVNRLDIYAKVTKKLPAVKYFLYFNN